MAGRSSNSETSRLLGIVLAVIIVASLYFAEVVFVPLALALLFAFVLTPAVMLLERARLHRTPATLMVLLVALTGLGSLGWVIARQFSDVINQLPLYQSNIEEKIRALPLSKNTTIRNAATTINDIKTALTAPQESSQGNSANGNPKARSAPATPNPVPVQVVSTPGLPLQPVQSGLKLLLQVIIVIVFTSFMLLQRENLRNRFVSLVGQRQLSAMTQALDEASDRVSRYLRTQLAVNAMYGTAIGIGLYFIGIPGAMLWGVIVGILRFLPYLGPPLGGIMPVTLSLALFHGWRVPLMTVALFVCIEILVSHAIEPMLYGAHTGVSSLAVLVAAVFWTLLWGPIGLVLSTPLTVCIVVLGRYVPHLSFLTVLLGGNPALPEEALVYQRLLAGDQEEAERILESQLEKRSPIEVFDSVLIPALSLAKQDRQRGQIDDDTIRVVFQGVREVIDDLHERAFDLEAYPGSLGIADSVRRSGDSPGVRQTKILCVPARDEADEIVALMLSHALQQAGQDAVWLPVSTPSETTERVKLQRADIVCISALPPFVISHSRALCRSLKTCDSRLPIVIGMWTFAGDTSKLSQRMRVCGDAPVVTGLADAVRKLAELQGITPNADERKYDEGTVAR